MLDGLRADRGRERLLTAGVWCGTSAAGRPQGLQSWCQARWGADTITFWTRQQGACGTRGNGLWLPGAGV